MFPEDREQRSINEMRWAQGKLLLIWVEYDLAIFSGSLAPRINFRPRRQFGLVKIRIKLSDQICEEKSLWHNDDIYLSRGAIKIWDASISFFFRRKTTILAEKRITKSRDGAISRLLSSTLDHRLKLVWDHSCS